MSRDVHQIVAQHTHTHTRAHRVSAMLQVPHFAKRFPFDGLSSAKGGTAREREGRSASEAIVSERLRYFAHFMSE